MKQGEIWQINLDPTVGAEIQKIRPSIIVSDDSIGKLPLKIIVPLSDWKDHYSKVPWMVRVPPDQTNQLIKISVADCFQVRSISEERFIRKVGEVDLANMVLIKKALALVLSIE
jgi:mRNA interferase MazF